MEVVNPVNEVKRGRYSFHEGVAVSGSLCMACLFLGILFMQCVYLVITTVTAPNTDIN